MRSEVERAGAISFHRFMELALYCPDFGYYERFQRAVGRCGDFVTSVSSGELFGQLLAVQFGAWSEGFAGWVHWIEAGAHDGRLAADILKATRERFPELYERLVYCVVEPSVERQSWQRATLGKQFLPKVRWVRSMSEVSAKPVQGIVFSNELLDAFPVHRLGWDSAARRWFEWGVKCAGDQFAWCRMREGDCDWSGALTAAGFDIPPGLSDVLPDQFVLELCPAAGRWWSEAASAIQQGRLMTIDYGMTAEQFISPERRAGTLRAYRRHSVSGDLLASPGEQDLTAHVNFSQLIQAGERAGMKTEQFVSQSEFIAKVFSGTWLGANSASPSQVRQFQSLTHPDHAGRAFRVLVQSRLA